MYVGLLDYINTTFMHQTTASPPDLLPLGLALSGGGMRGLAHVGVIQALEERDMTPNLIAAVSSGAIIGGLYASGLTSHEIAQVIAKKSVSSVIRPRISKRAFFDNKRIYKLLFSLFGNTRIEDMARPIEIIATDLLRGEIHAFTTGSLCDAVWASCSIPVLYAPVVIDDTPYADGGLLKLLPVSILRDRCAHVIGSNVNPYACHEKHLKENLFAITERTYKLMVRSNARMDMQQCDTLIMPHELSEISLFESKKDQLIINIGYREAIKQLHNWGMNGQNF